ncbi:MAG: NTP transferase domain-containing protein [Vicinamibacterales bacterium]
MSVIVRDAVILAAGNGDRFKNGDHHSKLLHPVAGQPLILRTLHSAAAAGITSFLVVVGFEADRVQAAVEAHPIPGTTVRFVYNPDWHLENGVSALAARQHCGPRRFALLMGDHLFESAVLQRMLSLELDPGVSVLAIDSMPGDPAVAAEATRVRMRAGRITAIGKDVDPWDALDTGLFVFSQALFDALAAAQAVGDTTLSAGVQRLAAKGLMRGADVAGATWCDVDTVEDLDAAESLLGAEREHV